MSVPGQIHALQEPLGAVRALPKVPRHRLKALTKRVWLLPLRSCPLLLLLLLAGETGFPECDKVLQVLVDGVGRSVNLVGILLVQIVGSTIK